MTTTTTNPILASLQDYFAKTPPDQIKEDWAKFDHLDDVGPTIAEFFEQNDLNAEQK